MQSPTPETNRKNWRTRTLLAAGGAVLFFAGVAVGGLQRPAPARAQGSNPGNDPVFDPFWETWDLLHQEYVDQPLDDTALVEGAINGMIATLGDQHTAYMNPDEYAVFDSDLSGEFEGIGAEVFTDEEGNFTIISPIQGSPAEAAGLQPGDVIVAVDGAQIAGISQSDIIARVRGPAGTPVVLTIKREGVPGTFDVQVIRDVIVLVEVSWQMVDGDIAYLELTQFSVNAASDMRAALQEIADANPQGLVLDLRGNPGGLLTSVIDITSEFIDEGPVMIERFGDGRSHSFDAYPGGLATDIPLVVLVDAGSASASEVLAAAIQDYGRGTIMGETSFGKGTVQSWFELSNGGAVRVTVARWLSPEGRWIHGEGIFPDVPIYWSGGRPDSTDDDTQLNAAINVLHGGSVWSTWPLPWLDGPPMGMTG